MDDDSWYEKYMALRGQRRGARHVPEQRPESPEQRMRQMGVNPGTPAPAAQPHFDPVPVRNPEALDQFLASLPAPQAGDNADLEMAAIPPHIRQRMMTMQQQRQQQQQMMPSRQAPADDPRAAQMLAARLMQQQQQTGTAHITEGAMFYRALQTGGFGGNSVPIVRAAGYVPSNVADRTEFVINGVRNCYVVQPGQTTVNMEQLNNNPGLLTPLIEIQAPMVGTLLVHREALMGGRQVMFSGGGPTGYGGSGIPQGGRGILRG